MDSKFYVGKCIICEKSFKLVPKVLFKKTCKTVTEDAFSTIFESVLTRVSAGEKKYSGLKSLCVGYKNDIVNKLMFHKSCYKSLTSKWHILNIKIKATVPDAEASTSYPPEIPQVSDPVGKCVFCKKETDQKCTKVTYKTMEKRIKDAVTGTGGVYSAIDSGWYHLKCLIKNERKAAKDTSEGSDQRGSKLMEDCIIINAIKSAFSVPATQLTMDDLLDTFNSIFEEKYNLSMKSRKIYLKKLIEEHIPDIQFIKQSRKNLPEVLVSKLSTGLLFAKDTESEEYQILYKAALILRKIILNFPEWKFLGSFEDYIENTILQSFLEHVVAGPYSLSSDPTATRDLKLKSDVSVLCQHLVMTVRTNRQVKYSTQHIDANVRKRTETPLTVGLPLMTHFKDRSRGTVEVLSSLNMSISYDRLMKLENQIASTIVKDISENGGYSLPRHIKPRIFTYFAIDNIDFREDTPSGRDTLHGTVIVIFQPQLNQEISDKTISIDRSAAPSKSFNLDSDIIFCADPKKNVKIKIKLSNYESLSNESQLSIKETLNWASSYINLDEGVVPLTWSAFNSVQTKPLSGKTNIGIVAPLIRSSPTNFSVLWTAISRARKINEDLLAPNKKTLITVDLQLYDMSMKLWMSDASIQRDFLFMPGPLHFCFWALHSLGHYIDESGIEHAWVESGMYSECVVTQILNGRHLYRALEAHSTTVLAILNVYIEKKAAQFPTEYEVLTTSSKKINSYARECKSTKNFDGFDELMNKVTETFNDKKIYDVMDIGKQKDSTAMEKFLGNYVRQFFNILNYVRSLRSQNAKLYVKGSYDNVKYFFTNNNLNYSRLIPLHLANITSIQNEDPDIWSEFEKGYFTVTKGDIAFTSIGVDHALEQENKTLKGKGGLGGITQKKKALDRYFIIASEMAKIADNFKTTFNCKSKEKNQHHELSGSKAKRIADNMKKLASIFNERDMLGSNAVDSLFNIYTQKKMDQQTTLDIINRDDIGKKLFETFVDERLNKGEKSIWDPLERCKIKSFSSSNVTAKVGKDVAIKDSRNLVHRFMVMARNRNMDLKSELGQYEFSVVPKPLFSADGSLLIATDEIKVLFHVEKMAKQVESDFDSSYYDKRILFMDGMDILQKLKKINTTRTIKDLAKLYLENVVARSQGFDEVRIIFQDFKIDSIEQQTTNFRQENARYFVNDNTNIANIQIKNFLGHIDTKAEISKYLSLHLLVHSRSSSNKLKKFAVTFGTTTEGNFEIPMKLLLHNHEEVRSLTILHASTIDQNDELVVESTDTELLMLLLRHYEVIPYNTYFRGEHGNKKINIDIKSAVTAIGADKVKSIVGFYVLTGTQKNGKFGKVTKYGSFKQFLKEKQETLEGLELIQSITTDPLTIVEKISPFICRIYKSPLPGIEESRWYLWLKHEDLYNIPPTKAALLQHVKRAQYAANILMSSTSPIINKFEITDYGWQKSGLNELKPIMTTKEAAPREILENVSCKCKTGCETNKCSCRRFNNTRCSDLCECHIFATCGNSDNIQIEDNTDSDDE